LFFPSPLLLYQMGSLRPLYGWSSPSCSI
jgi:hypothetical protein